MGIKKFTTTLLIALSISGCKKAIICAEIERTMIKPLPFCDVSFDPETRCRCRCFDMSISAIVDDAFCDDGDNIFHSGNFPLEACDQIVGPTLDDWAVHVKPKIRRANDIKNTYCK